MGAPDNFRKECAEQAVMSNAVVICPTIGYGPETKAAGWLKNGYAALKFVHSEAERLKIDTTRIAICGDSHGAYSALTVGTWQKIMNKI